MDQKVCFNLVKKKINCTCTHEQKMNFEGYTQNGFYGNQPLLFEGGFFGVSAYTSCFYTIQDLSVN